MNKFIIFTMGRSGSHIIYNYFIRHGFTGIHVNLTSKKKIPNLENLLYTKNLIIHSHNSNLNIPDPENWVAIISTRKDLFDQYCSFLIARNTNQYTEYLEIKKIQKIKINMKDAIIKAKLYHNYPKIIKNNVLKHIRWKGIVEITYEDLIHDDLLLFNKIPLDTPIVPKIKDFSSKSPYSFENHIENYRYQKSIFQKEFNTY